MMRSLCVRARFFPLLLNSSPLLLYPIWNMCVCVFVANYRQPSCNTSRGHHPQHAHANFQMTNVNALLVLSPSALCFVSLFCLCNWYVQLFNRRRVENPIDTKRKRELCERASTFPPKGEVNNPLILLESMAKIPNRLSAKRAQVFTHHTLIKRFITRRNNLLDSVLVWEEWENEHVEHETFSFYAIVNRGGGGCAVITDWVSPFVCVQIHRKWVNFCDQHWFNVRKIRILHALPSFLFAIERKCHESPKSLLTWYWTMFELWSCVCMLHKTNFFFTLISRLRILNYILQIVLYNQYIVHLIWWRCHTVCVVLYFIESNSFHPFCYSF